MVQYESAKTRKILRCTKVEVVGKKDGKERVIAVISKKDGQLVIDSEDKEFKKKLEEFLITQGERFLRFTEEDTSGFKRQVLYTQRIEDPFYLEALCGPWWIGKEIWGYSDVFAREAGKVWEEEVPLEMIWKEKKG